ncbi:zinc-ribbon domain-containing protein [Aquimarina spinulae]|uniref:zinc-ribbon domain-containing protein n=1 Tax=Aquimarina spinulae TaxID=1192023 RepID=UPI000D553D88|nr:zinc ribbon domain-containing protein [Aquimarina spinulae]
MLFFYGLNSSILKSKKLNNTKCPYCQTENSFTVTIFGKYFHIFWVPVFPISKTSTAKCSHCKKKYSEREFSSEMKTSLFKENQLNPVKTPIWHAIGCLVPVLLILVFILFIVFTIMFHSNNNVAPKPEDTDPRKILLQRDMNTLIENKASELDSTSLLLKNCATHYLNKGINTDKIKYFTKQNMDKLLVLLEIRDLKKIKVKSRKQLITLVEYCLEDIDLNKVNHYYIGIEGKYNTVLVKTPFYEGLGGRIADQSKLLDFYDSPTLLDSISNKTIDSTTISNELIKRNSNE